MSSSVDLHMSGAMDHLRIVWQAGETLLESVPYAEDPEGTRYNVLVALQEMVTNVLRYAYHGEEQPLVVQMRASEHGFVVQLKDRGAEFDPLAHHSDISDVMPADSGGYGIMIMRAVMDEVTYQRVDGWNVVTMKKGVRRPIPAGMAGL